ncbi:MAG TPA: DDE-type integrase/transposase/recombinase [Candidatus Saccharimonadales bacterium]|nr:DDE-type integrase/transposase/recombinase [Candidatus Saccharimonadales bacterium]
MGQSTISKWCKRAPFDLRKVIPTASSAPKTSPSRLLQPTIDAIKEARKAHNRCAEVVHDDVKDLGIRVSLSSVKRILKREGLLRPEKTGRRWKPPIPRPLPTRPGALVQMDTIHIVDWMTQQRFYIYTVIDVCSRWTYAEVHDQLRQAMSLKVALRAQAAAGFRFQLLQTDNGPEFKSYFRRMLDIREIALRHSRVRQSNDNAHIERFNRTIQDECLGKHPLRVSVTQSKLNRYLAYYNNERKHLSLKFGTPQSQLIIPRP